MFSCSLVIKVLFCGREVLVQISLAVIVNFNFQPPFQNFLVPPLNMTLLFRSVNTLFFPLIYFNKIKNQKPKTVYRHL